MISRILSYLQSGLKSDNDVGRCFWARLIRADGENALLETADGRRFTARLAARAMAGEKLLLQRTEEKDGIFHYRVLERVPAEGEPALTPPLSFAAVLSTGDREDTPCFLTAEERTDNDGGTAVKSWRFTLRTGNLGLVVLAAERHGDAFAFSVLAEDDKKAAILRSAMARDFQACRIGVMNRNERRLIAGNGTILNGLG